MRRAPPNLSLATTDTKKNGAPHESAAAEEGTKPRDFSYKSDKPTRYLRFFPERVFFLAVQLSPDELRAYLCIAAQFMVRDGQLPADDCVLAKIAALRSKPWLSLRTKLLELDICRVDDGQWIDVDQGGNLQRQREFSELQRQRVSKRYGGRNG